MSCSLVIGTSIEQTMKPAHQVMASHLMKLEQAKQPCGHHFVSCLTFQDGPESETACVRSLPPSQAARLVAQQGRHRGRVAHRALPPGAGPRAQQPLLLHIRWARRSAVQSVALQQAMNLCVVATPGSGQVQCHRAFSLAQLWMCGYREVTKPVCPDDLFRGR